MFVAARRVWNVVLFSPGIVLFVAPQRVGTSCCFPQGGKSSICNWLPLDQFGTSCHFPQGGKTYLLSLNWTSCLTSRHSKNLERRAVFSKQNILLFALLSSLDEFGTSWCLLTLFAFDRST